MITESIPHVYSSSQHYNEVRVSEGVSEGVSDGVAWRKYTAPKEELFSWTEKELRSLEHFEIPIDPRSHLEVIDTKNRYGKNLRLYFKSFQELRGDSGSGGVSGGVSGADVSSSRSELINDFFTWLDAEDKPEVEGCSRQLLDSETVYYCSTLEEAEKYCVKVDEVSGLLVWNVDGTLVTTCSNTTKTNTSISISVASPITNHLESLGGDIQRDSNLNKSTLHTQISSTSQLSTISSTSTISLETNIPSAVSTALNPPNLTESCRETLLAQTQKELPLTASFEVLSKSKRTPSFSSLAVDPSMTMPVVAPIMPSSTTSNDRVTDVGGGSASRRSSLNSITSINSINIENALRASCTSTDNENEDEVDSEDSDTASDTESEEGAVESGEEEISANGRASTPTLKGDSNNDSDSIFDTIGGLTRAAVGLGLRKASPGLLPTVPEQHLFIAPANDISSLTTTPASLQRSISMSSTNTMPLERWIFVLKGSCFYVHPKVTKTFPRFHHSSFLGGRPVDAAGIFSVRDGRIEELHLHSGHYRPTEIHLYRLLLLLQFRTSADAMSNMLVDAQRVMHIARLVNAEGSKMKKLLTTDLWPALLMLDFLKCKKHMWGTGVFRELQERRGQTSGVWSDVNSIFSSSVNSLTDMDIDESATGGRSPLRMAVSARLRAASEPPISPLTFGAYFGDYQMGECVWDESDLI